MQHSKEVLGANMCSLSVLPVHTASSHSPEAVIQGRVELAPLGMDAKPEISLKASCPPLPPCLWNIILYRIEKDSIFPVQMHQFPIKYVIKCSSTSDVTTSRSQDNKETNSSAPPVFTFSNREEYDGVFMGGWVGRENAVWEKVPEAPLAN